MRGENKLADKTIKNEEQRQEHSIAIDGQSLIAPLADQAEHIEIAQSEYSRGYNAKSTRNEPRVEVTVAQQDDRGAYSKTNDVDE